MSKLQELIKELCPDGVEHKELGSFATILRGGNFQKKIFVKMEYPVFIMDKFIHGMGYLRIKHSPILMKQLH